MKTLREIRILNNLTQKEMASKLKVSNSYYSKIEAGFKKPSFNFIKKVKMVYPTINIDIFFTNEYH